MRSHPPCAVRKVRAAESKKKPKKESFAPREWFKRDWNPLSLDDSLWNAACRLAGIGIIEVVCVEDDA